MNDYSVLIIDKSEFAESIYMSEPVCLLHINRFSEETIVITAYEWSKVKIIEQKYFDIDFDDKNTHSQLPSICYDCPFNLHYSAFHNLFNNPP